MRAGPTVMLGAGALAACSPEPGAGAEASAAAVKPEDRIACALPGKNLEAVCTREIASGPDGPIWIVRHPGGSFRRFVIIDNGTRIATADGADEVRTQRGANHLDVAVAGEQYRFVDGDVESR